MNKIISIIIPTFNMEEYLPRCLASLVADEKDTRTEAIIVNDGSNDKSINIAKEFAEKYPGTFRIIDKPNGNYGSCINAALKVATGKYIKILDADDCFDAECFNEFKNLLENTDADLVLNDYIKVMDGGTKAYMMKYPAGRVFDFLKEGTERAFISIMMHNVTYRRSIFESINYRQSEGIFYTDNEWTFMPMTGVKKAYYFSKPIYRYTIGREGQSVSNEVIIRHIHDETALSTKMLRDYNLTAGAPEEIRRLMFVKLYHHVRWLYKLVIVKTRNADSSILDELDGVIEKECPELYEKLDRKWLSPPLFCVRYIRLWRNNHNSKTLKRIIRSYQWFKQL